MRQSALFFLLASAACVQAQTVTLRLNPPAGKTYTYAMTLTMKQTTPQGPMTSKQSMNSVMKVLKNTGGKVTVENSTSGAKVQMSGPAAGMSQNIEKMLNSMKTTMTLDNLGHPIDMKGASGMQSMMSGMSSGMSSMASFPKEPVRVGSKWSSTMDFAKMLGGAMPNAKVSGGKMPVNMVLKRLETRGGKRVAIIGVSMNGTMKMDMGRSGGAAGGSVSTTTSTNGEMVLDIATGMPLEVTSTGKSLTSLGGMKMEQSTLTTMKLK